MVDPMCQVPFYDDYLCSALSAKGIDVTLFAREPSFIKGYFKKRNYSFRNLNRYTRKLFSEKSLANFSALDDNFVDQTVVACLLGRIPPVAF